MSNCVLSVRARIEQLEGICKDKHAYLRCVCAHALAQRIEDDTEEALVANTLFFPLRIAAETMDTVSFVPVALRAIAQLAAGGLVKWDTPFAPPNVAVPTKRKGFFSTVDITAPGLVSSANGEGVESLASAEGGSQRLSDAIIAVVRTHTRSFSEEVRLLSAQCFVAVVSNEVCGVYGSRMISCAEAVFFVEVESRRFHPAAQGDPQAPLESEETNSTVPNTPMSSIIKAVLARAEALSSSMAPAYPPRDTGVGHSGSDSAQEDIAAHSKAVSRRLSGLGGIGTEGSDVASVEELHSVGSEAERVASKCAGGSTQLVESLRGGSALDDSVELLNLLCRLSTAEGVGVGSGAAAPESQESRSRGVACALMCIFMENVGSLVAQSRRFHISVHRLVCASLLKTCTSMSPIVYRYALRLMCVTVVRHRAVLKSKATALLFMVLFPLLESASTPFQQKSSILTVLEIISSESQVLADWFLNFDCVPGAANLLDDFVTRLAKLAQTPSAGGSLASPKQDAFLRLQALRSLRNLVRAMYTFVCGAPRDEIDASSTGSKDATGSPEAPGRRPKGESTSSQPHSRHLSVEVDGHRAEEESAPALTDADIERLLRGKKAYEAVVEMFNTKRAKDAIAMGISTNLISGSRPEDVAQFLTTRGLNRVKIGEYLSHNDAETKAVLNCFIRLNDFSGLSIDEAMRLFLGKFKISGEAQTVDRTMEMFAEHYCAQNPGVFSTSGSAFVLAFSIMMLNTDAHSIHIKNKMTLDGFIRNNMGIDDGKDFPREFLTGIYERIVHNEIVLDDRGATAIPPPASSLAKRTSVEGDTLFLSKERRKLLSYRTEVTTLVQKSADVVSLDITDEPFQSATSRELAAAMWDCTWAAFLPSFSIPMEESAEVEVVDTCLEGFEFSIKLSCRTSSRTERKAFLSSLLVFTHLTSLREIEYKNLRSIGILIRVASDEGRYLESSWEEILRCISLLDRLHLFNASQPRGDYQAPRVTGAETALGDAAVRTPERDGQAGAAFDRGGQRSPHLASRMPGNPPHRPKLPTSAPLAAKRAEVKKFELQNAETISQYIDAVVGHRLFSNSGALSDTAIVDLTHALCTVSAEELAERPPRLFSLQKLIEVTETNVYRMRYVWSKMWVHVAKHFISFGSQNNQLVSMFLVDNLRQLAIKFLSRLELGSLSFQRDILKPFEVIARATHLPTIRELIVASLGQLVEAQAARISSGWTPLLTTLSICARGSKHEVTVASARLLEHITTTKLHLLSSPENLATLAAAWRNFGRVVSSKDDTALRGMALWYLRFLAAVVSWGVARLTEAEVLASPAFGVASDGDVPEDGGESRLRGSFVRDHLAMTAVSLETSALGDDQGLVSSGVAIYKELNKAKDLDPRQLRDIEWMSAKAGPLKCPEQIIWMTQRMAEGTLSKPPAGTPVVGHGGPACGGDDAEATALVYHHHQYQFSLWLTVLSSFSSLAVSATSLLPAVSRLAAELLLNSVATHWSSLPEGSRGEVLGCVVLPLISALHWRAINVVSREMLDHQLEVLEVLLAGTVDLLCSRLGVSRTMMLPLVNELAALCSSGRGVISQLGFSALGKLLKRCDAIGSLTCSDWKGVLACLAKLRDDSLKVMKSYWEQPPCDLFLGSPSQAAASLSRLVPLLGAVLAMRTAGPEARDFSLRSFEVVFTLTASILSGSRMQMLVSFSTSASSCRHLDSVLALQQAVCLSIQEAPGGRSDQKSCAMVQATLSRYLRITAGEASATSKREEENLRGAVVNFLHSLRSMEWGEAEGLISVCLPELCDLIRGVDAEVSAALSDVFHRFCLAHR